MKQGVVLIGMPGSGKSTVGVVLAKQMGCGFIDADLEIQKIYDKRLFELIAEKGKKKFLDIENEVNHALYQKKCVIATGGSAIYGEEAMEAFFEHQKVVYLQLSFEQVKVRLEDLNERGVVMEEGQSLLDLYQERISYYEKYAHITINCDGKEIATISKEIVKAIGKNS